MEYGEDKMDNETWYQDIIEHCPIKDCKGMLMTHDLYNYHKCSECGRKFALFMEFREIDTEEEK